MYDQEVNISNFPCRKLDVAFDKVSVGSIVSFCYWKSIFKFLDKGELTGAVLFDLSKAFTCIDYTLLIAKVHAYNLNDESHVFVKC